MIPDLQRPTSRTYRPAREVVVLGSTGSIGTQTLEVAALFPERLRIRALSAGRNWELLAEQARAVRVELVTTKCIRVFARVAVQRAH